MPSCNSSIEVQPDEEQDTISSILAPDDQEIYSISGGNYIRECPDEFPNATSRILVNRDLKVPIISTASTRNPSTHDAAADLGNYIATSYSGIIHYPREGPIFHQGIGHFRPQLKLGRVNRIIIYPGCFNPPHLGHLAVLNRAFSCAQDLNVIAAIVIPVGNRGGDSEKDYTEKVSLTQSQRARLWTGGHEPHDWLWVFGGDSDEWDVFRWELTRMTARDGFDLQFVWLGGPDHVGRYHASDSPWDCKDMIVTDAGREADFVKADGSLDRITGCGSWTPVSLDKKKTIQEATNTAEWILSSLSVTVLGQRAYDGLIEEIALEYTTRMKGVRVCKREGAEDGWIRFVPASNGPMQVSSTDIRRTISTCRLDGLFEKLKGKALHPEILIQHIRDAKHSK
ncbi:hypothetical protein F5Y13DRAFT_194102 [Hypoxylon sp. FL1857]|nr:hypothetical protein F5Y13DRAFT_194102 [Hypoxylon sp. FL1857]